VLSGFFEFFITFGSKFLKILKKLKDFFFKNIFFGLPYIPSMKIQIVLGFKVLSASTISTNLIPTLG